MAESNTTTDIDDKLSNMLQHIRKIKELQSAADLPLPTITDEQNQLKLWPATSASDDFDIQTAPTIRSDDSLFHSPDYIKTSTSLHLDTRYSIDPDKYCKIFRGYVRQDWDTINVKHGADELRAGWIDILFDLIFVACVVHISIEAAHSIPSDNTHRRLGNTIDHADTIDHTPSDHTDSDVSSMDTMHHMLPSCHSGPYDFLFTCFAQFGLLSLFWMEQTMVDTHFVFNQHMDEVLELFYMIFILSTGLFIQNDELYHVAFQISYLCLRLIAILIYLKAYLIPRAKLHSLWHISINVMVILGLFIIAIVFRGCAMDYFIIYTMFFLFEYVSFIMHWYLQNEKGELLFALALHVAHISERFGLFVMLILGEAIISIMTSEIGAFSLDGVYHIIYVVLTFIMTFCIAKLYFECQPNEEAIMHGTHNHALRTTIFARILYIVSHHILFFGLLGFGLGSKIAFKHLNYSMDERESIDLLLPGYSLVLIVISLNIIRWSHPFKITSKRVWIFRGILILIMAIAPLFIKSVHPSILYFVVLLCLITLNFADVEGRRNRNKSKREFQEKREKEKAKAQHIGSKNVRGTQMNIDIGSLTSVSSEQMKSNEHFHAVRI